METIKLTTRIDDTGRLHLDISTRLPNHNVEVLVVLQPTPEQPKDMLGWPVDFFETLDAIEADDLVERPDQGTFEEREPVE